MSDLKFIKIFVPLVLGGGFSIPLRGNSVENNCPNILFTLIPQHYYKIFFLST